MASGAGRDMGSCVLSSVLPALAVLERVLQHLVLFPAISRVAMPCSLLSLFLPKETFQA